MKEEEKWKESEKYIEAEMRVGSSLPTGEAVEWRVFRMQRGRASIVTAACHSRRKTDSPPQEIPKPRPQEDT